MSNQHPLWLNALSESALNDLAGPSVLSRGHAYATSGAIQDPEIAVPETGEQIALQAVVRGTEPYDTRVWIDASDQLDGDCSCPHARDGHFCKHQVALALTLRSVLGGDAPVPDEQAAQKVAAAAKRAQTQTQNREALRHFVQQQSAEALAERLWQWAENDRDLMADLKAWAVEQQHDPKALNSAITDLLRNTRGFLDWRDSTGYAQRAEKVLPLLKPWLQKDPVALRELCDHTLRRLYKVAADADDSGGEIGDLIHQVMELLRQSLQAAPPPAAWLERWFALMEADPWGLWDEAAILSTAGPAVQARYAERAARDWQCWLAAHPPQPEPAAKSQGRGKALLHRHEPYDTERDGLRRRYLRTLEQQGDVQAGLDARRQHLANAGEHSELIAFAERHGRYREAMQLAQTARRRYPDDWRTEADLLRCYERDGWEDEALAIRRQQLERSPSAQNYHAVLAAAERAGRERASYRAELFDWACEQEGLARTRTGKTPDVSVRINWLLADRCQDEALELAASPMHRCATSLLRTLARDLPRARDAEAVPLLLRVFAAEMANATSPYRAVLALVGETLPRMTPEQREDWLSHLRTDYKAKRNFIAGLP